MRPRDAEFLRELVGSTPARIGRGRVGTRLPTSELLALRADHAAARDAVDADLPDHVEASTGCVATVRTLARDRPTHLSRPDLGRMLDPEDRDVFRRAVREDCDVLVAVGDGLSSLAVERQVPRLVPVLFRVLATAGVGRVAGPVLVRHARVGLMNELGDLSRASVVVLLVGERPGLSTATSLSAYLGWEPRPGKTDADRNVVSNIHDDGLPAERAGDEVGRLVAAMLAQRTSGVGFRP